MLRILLTGLVLAAPLAVQAQDYLPNLFDVTVVETWDKLNVREAPDGQAKIIGRLASTAKGVELLDRDASGKWGLVNVGETTGWVALRFLKPQATVWKPAELPLALRCSGTEPFWSVKTVQKADLQRARCAGAPAFAAQGHGPRHRGRAHAGHHRRR